VGQSDSLSNIQWAVISNHNQCNPVACNCYLRTPWRSRY